MTTTAPTRTPATTPVLGRLRALTPQRQTTFIEALRIAELQASKLANLLDTTGDGLSEHHIAGLPRITVSYKTLPISGMSHWDGRQWVIAICRTDSQARQRFTLLHEYKHIIDHGQTQRLYTGNREYSAHEQAERAADYFAGCALVSKRRLKRAWGDRIQRVFDLAQHFGVSEHAIRVRLAQTGLNIAADRRPTPRCARPVSTPHDRPQRFRLANRRYATRGYA